MAIREILVPRYYGVCDNCGWMTSRLAQERYVERELSDHKCGEHRQEYDSTGGLNPLTGRYRRYCVCGVMWTVESSTEAFKCPEDKS